MVAEEAQNILQSQVLFQHFCNASVVGGVIVILEKPFLN
jgi:hypothetical protein